MTLTTGEYLYEGISEFGCDSVSTMTFTLLDDSLAVDSLVVCDSVLWNGTVFDSDTTYLWTGQNAEGCSAEVTLELTVHPSYDLEADSMDCAPIWWNGMML